MANGRLIDKSMLDPSLVDELNNKRDVGTTIYWIDIANKPQLADSSWRTPVANVASLPTTGNVNGDVRLALATNEVYEWNGTAWNLIGANDTNIDWSSIQAKPTTYPPSAHTHPQSDVTNLVSDLASKASTSSLTTHTGDAVAHITSAERTAWNAKQSALGYTPENPANKGAVNGYASLGSDGKVPSGQLPAATGDMLKSVYDTTANGIVDQAEAVPWTGVTSKPTTVSGYGITDAVQQAAFDGHTGNTVLHVTQADKDAWNGKQVALGYTPENPANKGVVNGYASLGADGLIPPSQLPAATVQGDMLKSVYDTTNNGIVDQAEAVPWSGITSKPTTVSTFGITDALTTGNGGALTGTISGGTLSPNTISGTVAGITTWTGTHTFNNIVTAPSLKVNAHKISVDTTAPTSPATNDIWIDLN